MNSARESVTLKRRLFSLINSAGVWIIFLLMFVALSIFCEGFLTAINIRNVLRQICVNAIVALGVTFVVSCGLIDLSTGSMATFAGVGVCLLIVNLQMNTYLAMLIGLAAGALVGSMTGVIITRLRVEAFITTLGMQYALGGIVLVLTQSNPVIGLPDNFGFLGRGYIGEIPMPVIVLALVFIIATILYSNTTFGRNVQAVGENPVASRLSGINVKRIQIKVCALSGLLSALAGIVLASRMNSGQPSSGSDIPLQAMAAVFVGGTTISSSSGKGVSGTIAGALIVGLVNNGLNLLGVNSYWQNVALGVIIIVAVALDRCRTRISAK